MKKSPLYITRKLQGCVILIPAGAGNSDNSQMLRMNESGTVLWEALGEGEFTVEDVARVLQEHYGGDAGTALSNASDAVKTWVECGAVCE